MTAQPHAASAVAESLAEPLTEPLAESPGEVSREVGWTVVCGYDDLLPERGAAALVDGTQVALFRTHTGEVFAIGNQDPFSGANVLSRGIVGSRGDAPTVSSPVYKQVFDLRSGACVSDPGEQVPTYPVRWDGGVVRVAVRSGP